MIAIEVEVEIDADPERAMETARALCDQLGELGVAESVELARDAAGVDAGAKDAGDTLTLAKVILTLLPGAAQTALDWLRDYFRRPGATPIRVKVMLESGASVEAVFDPRTVDDEEIVRIAGALKSVAER